MILNEQFNTWKACFHFLVEPSISLSPVTCCSETYPEGHELQGVACGVSDNEGHVDRATCRGEG